MINARNRNRKFIGLAIGLGLFGLVLYQLDIGQIVATLRNLKYLDILVACGMFAVSYAIKVSKWYFMQRRAHLNRSVLSVAHLYFGTRMGGLVTPMRSGEFIPGLLGEEKGAILAITFFDRIIESTQTLLTFAVVFALFAYKLISPASIWPLLLFAFLLILLCFPFFFPEQTAHWIPRILTWVGQKKQLRRMQWFSALELQIRENTERFFKITTRFFSPTIIMVLLVITFCGWLFDTMVFFFVFRSVGMFLSLTTVMISMAMLSMINFIAPTPSGLGVGDASLALILQPLGYLGEIGAFLLVARLLVALLTTFSYMLFNWLDGGLK